MFDMKIKWAVSNNVQISLSVTAETDADDLRNSWISLKKIYFLTLHPSQVNTPK